MNALAKRLSDELNRSVKIAMDTGESKTVEDAIQLFESYKIQIAIGSRAAVDPCLQVAAMTAVNCAKRVFLGGVTVVGGDGPLAVKDPVCTNLAEMLARLGGQPESSLDSKLPTLLIGDAPLADLEPLAIRLAVRGWSGGVIPAKGELPASTPNQFPPAGVLAGALGVSDIFQRVRKSDPRACRRSVGLNLWRLDEHWQSGERGPRLELLPRSAWLVGLGHLGQAFLWTLSMLPYGAEATDLVLQDFDTVRESNISTSLLTTEEDIGRRKTRVVSDLAEARGFKTSIVERRFDGAFQVNLLEEPAVALIGVDNALARRAVEDVGFDAIIEAGLGWGPSDYLGISVHTFPGARRAQSMWLGSTASMPDISKPAYEDLRARTADECGTIEIAGRSVGAPFVGAAAASIVVAELLRLAAGNHRYEQVLYHLRNPSVAETISSEAPAFISLDTVSMS